MLKVKCISVGPLGANCYLLYNQIDAIIIDPGFDGQTICDLASKLNIKIKHIILTHGHFDHIGAVSYIKDRFDCDVYIHKNDGAFLNNPSLNLSDRFASSILYDGAHTCVGEETLNLLEYDFKFISTPGHTPGSVCIMVEDMLFTGDTLFRCSIGNAFPPYGNTVQEIKSIKEKILKLDDSLICYPGHGEPTTIGYEKQFNPYLV